MIDFNVSEVVTAVATAATAVITYMQMRLQISAAKPHINAYHDRAKSKESEGLLLIQLVIYPGVEATTFTKVTAKGADIIPARFDVNQAGLYEPAPPTSPLLRSAPVSFNTPPVRTSSEPLHEYFWIKPRKEMSSVCISIHTRVMCFPMKYSATADIKMST